MTNYTAQPNAPAAISATYPAQPTEFERQCFTRDRALNGLKALKGDPRLNTEDHWVVWQEAEGLIEEFLNAIGAKDMVAAWNDIGE